jgi:serine/threonine-protein phosphatase 2A activator
MYVLTPSRSESEANPIYFQLAPSLLSSLLPEEFHAAIPLLLPYLLISFGSFTRIDYGSGHELSFATFLLSLTLLRFFDPSSPSEERNLVLVVFKKYLDVVWKLQDVYKLEPAGSHGVWGLDDYHFLTYLWGSAELRSRFLPLLSPYSRTQPSNPDSPTVPSIVLNPNLPTTNLYYLSISRIYSLKTGPFHEHSSLLHSVASSVPNWGKVNSGLWKMYEKEVLSKRVVVQHLPLGGLIGCDEVKPNDDGRSVRAVSVPLGGVRGSAVTASRDGGSRQKGLMGPPPPPTPL